jgi:hypothetical protein
MYLISKCETAYVFIIAVYIGIIYVYIHALHIVTR